MKGLADRRTSIKSTKARLWLAAALTGLAVWSCSDWGVFIRDMFGLPVFFVCHEVRGEYGDYRAAMCEYVVDHQIRTINPMGNEIIEAEEITLDGRQVLIVKMRCCGQGGDTAILDLDTGEVIDYTRGPNVY